MPRKLYDIDVDEITICESAASRKQFFIKKSKEKPMEKFIEVLKGFVVDEDDDDFTDEEIAKASALGKEPKATLENALNTFVEYKESMPDDLLAAAKIVVREAALGHPVAKEDLEKAGAALSKTTKAQITKALELLKGSPAAIAVLKTMLGQKVEKVDETGSGEEEALSAETQAKLEKLEGLEKAEKERIEKEQEEAEKKAKEKAKETEERLEALEKEHGIKQSLEEEDEDEDLTDEEKKKKKLEKDKNKDQWPSLYVPGLAGKG